MTVLRVSFSTEWDDGGPIPDLRAGPVPPVRADRTGRLVILAAVPGPAGGPQPRYRFLRVDSAGWVEVWSEIALDAKEVEGWHVLDFQPDHQGGLYMLEALQSPGQKFALRLRRVASTGETIWSRQAPHDTRRLDFHELAGKFERLAVPSEDSLYLLSRYPVQGVARLDVETGKVGVIYDIDEPFDQLTVDSEHRAYFSRRIEEAGRSQTVLVRRTLETGERDVLTPELDQFTELAGVDDHGRIYPRLWSGIARLSAEGSLEWLFEPQGMAVRSVDSHVFVLTAISREPGGRYDDPAVLGEFQVDATGAVLIPCCDQAAYRIIRANP